MLPESEWKHMVALADELYSDDQCSMGWRHWTREELERYAGKAAELAELILELLTNPAIIIRDSRESRT
jgi:hypothetical protein